MSSAKEIMLAVSKEEAELLCKALDALESPVSSWILAERIKLDKYKREIAVLKSDFEQLQDELQADERKLALINNLRNKIKQQI